MAKPKKGLFPILKNIFSSPVVRGIIKGNPIGGVVYEIVQNISHARNPDKKGFDLPHSPVSILFQIAVLICILYAFFTKALTIEDILRFVGPDDFKNFVPADHVLSTDSIPA